ncbi:unnamed protein product [Vitrella brassicaformis CCMP3155]|uniref:Uncharacterized protein n=1 Tax=Vitrella brassicaformis (strain CCMP3155) TaxID=1169540 RepID=A0A0G4FKU8_VITBC|nr:unnamed protein product [Vitrella brassicaformis CCMP3155]|eukprot:CEM13994.1 unnamed protein product [Vitrella brassicaformis CCMP3155]
MCYTSLGVLSGKYQRVAMSTGLHPVQLPFTPESLLYRLEEHWDAIEIDRSHSQSLADPTDMTAKPEHRHVWLTEKSAERLIGKPGYRVALLPAAIDEKGRQRQFRHLYRLQVFRKPAMDMAEQATEYDSQCSVRVYHGQQPVCAVPYVPVEKSKADKLCATCLVPCAGGKGICGKQNTYRNMVNSHLRKTHKLTEADLLQGFATVRGPSVPETPTNTKTQADTYGSHMSAGSSNTDVAATPPSVDALPIDGKEMPQPHLAHRLALDSYGAAAGVTGNVNQMAPPYFGYYRPDSSDSMMASNSDNEDGFGGTGPFVPFLMAPGDFKAFDRADDESEENAWLGVICNNTPQ